MTTENKVKMKLTKEDLTNLKEKEWKSHELFAEHGEEGILKHIFEKIGFGKNKFVLDIGAGHQEIGSSTVWLRKEYKLNSLLFDCHPRQSMSNIIKDFLTKENILSLLENHNAPNNIDMLNVDIDGNDYWILKEILDSKKYSFNLIMVEINPNIPHDKTYVMPYNGGARKHRNINYGAGLAAFDKLLSQYGYKLLHKMNTPFKAGEDIQGPSGRNAIFMNSDLLPDDFNTTVKEQHPEAWREYYKFGNLDDYKWDTV